MPPCILFEDEHLLVVNKPAGLNTHAPGPFAGEGIYDWLRHREPRWAGLAIIHRLDKETSGVMVFGKTPAANRSLTEQFTRREVRKRYLLVTDRSIQRRELFIESRLVRAGERYRSGKEGQPARTRFRVAASADLPALLPAAHGAEFLTLEAEPFTGRTHQIRVHAAENGFPILGDILYGGTPFPRVCLHASELAFSHPASGTQMTFRAPVNFAADARQDLRGALIDPQRSNAFRVVHGGADGHPGWYVDRLRDFLLSQSASGLTHSQRDWLRTLPGVKGVYHKILNRQVRRAAAAEASPQCVDEPFWEEAPERFTIRENGIEFELSFNEGYSVGLFLDQRDNRRRLLTGHAAAGFELPTLRGGAVLNLFAYTCGFSVCAAAAGARTTSVDLSRKYLEWGKRNFTLNGLDPGLHEFIYGDALDWMRRLAKKGRSFDVVLLDPPTFSQSKEHGAFQVERDYPRLVRAALPLLKPAGVLFASTNAAGWEPEEFVAEIDRAVRGGKRQVLRRHYVPQPPDFPVSRNEPAYLKTLWLQIGGKE